MDFPWNETKQITFVPRFVVMNATHRPIVLGQQAKDADRQYCLGPKDEMTYFFEEDGKKIRL